MSERNRPLHLEATAVKTAPLPLQLDGKPAENCRSSLDDNLNNLPHLKSLRRKAAVTYTIILKTTIIII